MKNSMQKNKYFLLIVGIFLIGCFWLSMPKQVEAYRVSYDGISFEVDSLAVSVEWSALGMGDPEGSLPFFALNGGILQYDYDIYTYPYVGGYFVPYPWNHYISGNLSLGTNAFSIYSNNAGADACGCNTYSIDYWDDDEYLNYGSYPCDGVYAKITFANGQVLYTNASTWLSSRMDYSNVQSPISLDACNPQYIQSRPCGNCCYTWVWKNNIVVENSDNGCAANTCVGQTCWNGYATVAGTNNCDGQCAVYPAPLTSEPTVLCLVGTPSVLTSNFSNWNWSCTGINDDGAISNCSAEKNCGNVIYTWVMTNNNPADLCVEDACGVTKDALYNCIKTTDNCGSQTVASSFCGELDPEDVICPACVDELGWRETAD